MVVLTLASVRSICALRLAVTFTNTQCIVTRENIVKLRTYRTDGLYVFHVHPSRCDQNALHASRNSESQGVQLWHHRMVHQCYHGGLITFSQLVTGMDQCVKPRSPCEECVKAIPISSFPKGRIDPL
jgi:hypothetical protein